jgi:hypothetical protein
MEASQISQMDFKNLDSKRQSLPIQANQTQLSKLSTLSSKKQKVINQLDKSNIKEVFNEWLKNPQLSISKDITLRGSYNQNYN